MRRKLSVLLIIILSCYLLFNNLNIDSFAYVFEKRLFQLVAMFLISISISVSTSIFQAITVNRILTPSIMGYDQLFVFIQTTIIFVLGSTNFIIVNPILNFALSTTIIMILSFFIFNWFLKNNKMSIFHLMLVGIIFSSFINNMSRVIKTLLDPNDYLVVQDISFFFINNVEKDIVIVSSLLIIIILVLIFKKIKFLDVIQQGKDISINLGINYQSFVYKLFMIISVLAAISTSLVGPILFLGFISINISKQINKTDNNKEILIDTIIVSVILVLVSFLISLHVFNLMIPTSLFIDLLGGIYFMKIIFKGGRI